MSDFNLSETELKIYGVAIGVVGAGFLYLVLKNLSDLDEDNIEGTLD